MLSQPTRAIFPINYFADSITNWLWLAGNRALTRRLTCKGFIPSRIGSPVQVQSWAVTEAPWPSGTQCLFCLSTLSPRLMSVISNPIWLLVFQPLPLDPGRKEGVRAKVSGLPFPNQSSPSQISPRLLNSSPLKILAKSFLYSSLSELFHKRG